MYSEVEEHVELILAGLATIAQEGAKRLSSTDKNFPYIVVVIDTFSDISYYDQEKFESLIKGLTSNSDKTKIHVVMCDSRVREELFNENIKSCFPTKIAFKTHDATASKAILGQFGAEKLKGKGDMLYLSPNTREPLHLQAPYLPDQEIASFVSNTKNKTDNDLGFAKDNKNSLFCKAFIVDLLGKRYMLHVWLKPYFSIGWHRKRDGLAGKMFWLERYN